MTVPCNKKGISEADIFINMLQDFTGNSTFGKHYYIKRKLIKDEALIYNGSIFPASDSHETSSLIHRKSANKHQTITTNIDHTVTLNTNNDEEYEPSEKRLNGDRSGTLPHVYTASQSKYSRQTKSNEKQGKQFRPKEKATISHITDPLYLKLQRNIAKRLNDNFNHYKRGWLDSSLRRKGKSVIERSLQKAASKIQRINTDSTERRTQTKFTQMLRNNHQERRFSFPARMRPDIDPLRGKGGKVVPLIKQKFILQQVYRYDKGQ